MNITKFTRNIALTLFIGSVQTKSWADFPPFCTDYGPFYDCKIGENCSCTIHPGLPGDVGSYYFKLAPIERKEYQCIFSMSPLSLYVNFYGSEFPEKVIYKADPVTSSHLVNVWIDARNMEKYESSYVKIRIDFGAYDSPSILSTKCVIQNS